MTSTRRPHAWPIAVGAVVLALAGGSAAASASAQVTPKAALTGYQQVVKSYAVGWETQGTGTAACPAGTVLVGGGIALTSTSALSEVVGSSYPAAGGGSWVAVEDNPIQAGTDFSAWATCVKRVAKYAVVAGTAVKNPAGSQTAATVACPSGTVALGGGGSNSSGSTAVSLNDDYPTSTTTWRAVANNASGGTNKVQAFVICGKKPAGYALVQGAALAVGPSVAQASTFVVCPSGTKALGGGADSSSGSVTVQLSGTNPSGSSAWAVSVNDTSTVSSTITAYAICASA